MDKAELSRKIGERIVQIRVDKGMSQSELARACMKDRQAIEKIEKGKVNPTIFSLYEIAIALKVSLTELINF